jgi:hypothetical protein
MMARMIRGRLFGIAALATALLVLASLFVAYVYSWTSPPVYRVPASLTLPVPVAADAVGGAARTLRIDSGGGALLLFGALPTNDPAHAPIAAIRRAWEDFRPTVVLCEGRFGFFVGGFDRGVRRFGEAAAAYALGRRDNLAVFSLEPDAGDEVARLVARFPREQVALFLALRDFVGERERGRVPGPPEEAMQQALTDWSGVPALEGSIPSIEAFDAQWRAQFPTEGDWRTIARARLSPGDDAPLRRLAALGRSVRGEHMVRAMVDLVRQGQRVFAVCDHALLPMQEPALRAALPG